MTERELFFNDLFVFGLSLAFQNFVLYLAKLQYRRFCRCCPLVKKRKTAAEAAALDDELTQMPK